MTPPGTGQTPPSTENGPVLLDRNTAQAFADATKYVRTMFKGRDPRGSPRGVGINPGMLAVTNSAIGPGTATTPTSGTVTFRQFDGTTISADTGNTTAAFSYHDKTIAGGSLVFLAWSLGYWWIVDVRSCSNLS